MQEFNAAEHRIGTASALAAVRALDEAKRQAAYIGLDVHKEESAIMYTAYRHRLTLD